ncbi:AAA family ATPase [Orbus wheelerorum]|uniref:AAA family ATPase n=1 Tax=Orbus wheelerorum TaxID=3074111 RepID=UPI00370D9E9E
MQANYQGLKDYFLAQSKDENNRSSDWYNRYTNIHKQLKDEFTQNRSVSDVLLKKIWCDADNGVATISQTKIQDKFFELAKDDLRQITIDVINNSDDSTYEQVVKKMESLKEEKKLDKNYKAVIYRLYSLVYPEKFISIVVPRILFQIYNNLNDKFSLNLPNTNDWYQNNIDLKSVLNKKLSPDFDAIKVNVLIWDIYAMQSENTVMNNNVVNKDNNHPLNQILYGPPGTGKTYHTINKALEIIGVDIKDKSREQLKQEFDKRVNSGQIVFTTFHQSLCYEDFIEGIKPVLKDDDEERKDLSYIIEAGIFKQLCNSMTSKVVETSKQKLTDIKGRTIWKMSLGNTNGDDYYVYSKCIENNCIALGYGLDINFSLAKNRAEITQLYQQNNVEISSDFDYQVTSIELFKNRMKLGDLVIVSDGNQKFRAIGEISGEYRHDPNFISEWRGYSQLRNITWHRVYDPSKPINDLFDKNLSQMTLYQLREHVINLNKLEGLLTDSIAVIPEQNRRVLIIDEINRGNISQIFGELITLIEDDKRLGNAEALTVTLPYSKEAFGVPSNLYIIGTMNTADRSVEALDTALRRRFCFTEMLPDPACLVDDNKNPINIDGIVLKDLLTTINKRIERLLDRDHQIGHSYFINVKDKADLANVFNNKVVPLLQEYFFNDYGKIGLVLGKGFFETINNSESVDFANFDDSVLNSLYQEQVIYRLELVNENTIIQALKQTNITNND